MGVGPSPSGEGQGGKKFRVLSTGETLGRCLACSRASIGPVFWTGNRRSLALPPLRDDLAAACTSRLQAAAPFVGRTAKETISVVVRSEERRVGKEGVSTCSSRWSPDHSKNKTNKKHNN